MSSKKPVTDAERDDLYRRIHELQAIMNDSNKPVAERKAALNRIEKLRLEADAADVDYYQQHPPNAEGFRPPNGN